MSLELELKIGFIKKINSKLLFENLTMAPIDTDLINHKMLNKEEKNIYLSIILMFTIIFLHF